MLQNNKTEVTIRRKPGASPLLFGKYLMDTCAFVSLEDISDALPAYREDVVPVALAGALKAANQRKETSQIRKVVTWHWIIPAHGRPASTMSGRKRH